MGGASGRQWLEMMGLSFGIIVVPFIGENIVILMLELRYMFKNMFW